MEKDLVSVIIPIYNVEAYLEKCVDSVLKQTYKNMEILLVNDGSTDHCLEICRRYEARDARIRVIDKKNGGLSDARNAGMEIATGKYYYFLDSDDFIKETLIETCVDAMQKYHTDMVAFNFEHISEDGHTWVTDTFPDRFYPLRNERERMHFFAHTFFEYKCGFEAWNRMYRASVIKNNHLKYVKNKLIFAEDICFNMDYLCCAQSVKVIEDRMHFYLQRSSSIMGQAKNKLDMRYYVNIGMHNDLVLKRNAKDALRKYEPMIYALLFERMVQNASFQERGRQIEQFSESQKKFHNVMLHRFQRGMLRDIRMIGLKKTAKLWVHHWYYLTENALLGRILQKVEMELIRRGK